jgi:hypothetical protein
MKHISEYLDEAFKEMFEERAAIREFDGQQTREEAEEQAAIEVKAAGGVKKK